MSLIKRVLERQMEEGWRSIGGSVCAKCLKDYAIRNYVDANLSDMKCTYCGRTSDTPIAADMDEVLSFISCGIWREYDIPENTLPYDSSEGGWQLMDPMDSSDVFGGLDIEAADSGELLEDIIHAFADSYFVPRDPLVLSESEGLKYSWSGFCEHIKHETRFVFFRARRPREPKKHVWHPDDRWGGYSPPYQILLGLGKMVVEHNLVSVIPRNAKFVRARQHPKSESPGSAAELGAPPKDRARQSRMSPAGIPMFYCASDTATAFLETYDSTALASDAMTFGVFSTNRNLHLLDLTQLPQIPSIFDEANFDRRPALIFLREFQKDVSKPIIRDGREHFEYVPTQVVAEYFRRVFRHGRRGLDGVIFPSSRSNGNACYCIFATPDQCFDGAKASREHLLRLDSFAKHRLDFTTNSYF